MQLKITINKRDKCNFEKLAISEGLTLKQWSKHALYKKYKSTILIPSYVKEPQSSNIYCSTDVIRECKDFSKSPVEYFYVFTLNSSHAILEKHMITKGIANSCQVHPREVFLPAIKDRAIAILCVHNHPSGDCTPSSQDNSITRQLVMAGKIIGIDLLDHIIISPFGNITSYKNLGLLSKYETEAKDTTGY